MNLSITDVGNKERGDKTPTRFHYGPTIVYLLPHTNVRLILRLPLRMEDLFKKDADFQSVIFFFGNTLCTGEEGFVFPG
jgi:hypothetical protein